MEDDFDWSLPKNCVHIQYRGNSDYGRCTKSVQNSAVNQSKTNAKRTLKYIGGVDISFAKPGAFEYDKASAGLTIYEYPSMKCVQQETAIVTLKHPYIAGMYIYTVYVKKSHPNSFVLCAKYAISSCDFMIVFRVPCLS